MDDQSESQTPSAAPDALAASTASVVVAAPELTSTAQGAVMPDEATQAEPGDASPTADPGVTSPVVALRLKKLLLAHLRNELSTPINAIIGYSEMLLEDVQELELEGFEADLQKILHEGEHLRQVFNQIVQPSQLTDTHSEVALEAFGARIRYEMRTPLTTIIGYCELLLEDAETMEDGRFGTDLGHIHTAAGQLLTLIDDLVRLSKLQAGAIQPEVEFPEIAPLIQDLMGAVRPLAEDQHLRQGATGRILLVDDSRVSRELISQRLGQQGYEVSLATNGQLAMEMVVAQPYDLVLLDMVMPGLNGYQVLTQMKEDKALRHIPVLMISAVDDIDVMVRCLEMGAENYLSKDVNPTLLKACIQGCLEKKRLHDQEVRLLEQEVRLFDELQENYRRLQELENLRDSLTSMIVHDLRTPLTSLLTGLQTVEVLGDLNEDQQEFMNISVEGGQALLSMINDLLDISKMEGSSLTLEYQQVTAADLVQRALQQVASLAEGKTIKLTSELTYSLPAFQADQEKLLRTLVNLLGNAIKFTPVSGQVSVIVHNAEAAASGHEVLFAVRDTGEGIPPEAFGRIFEKFGQVEGRKSGRKMSTGLGLTFCKMVAEAHGGRIWVESELGQGSTFTFAVPVQPVAYNSVAYEDKEDESKQPES